MRPPAPSEHDPFHERPARLQRRGLHLLGALFRFESNSSRLLRLVEHAFAGLPRHDLWPRSPQLHVRLLLTRDAGRPGGRAPPRLQTAAGPGFVCGTIDAANFSVICPAQRSALVCVSPTLLRHPYHARYELIEFAVYVLAARAQGLVPLHAAAVGRHGRGLLLVGDSGAGKSTLALHCLLQGLQILSEDAVFVRPRGLEATGVANFLHLLPAGLSLVQPHPSVARIRAAPLIQRRSGAEKHELDLRHAGWQLAAAPLPIRSVVFLSKQPAGKHKLLLPLTAHECRRRLAGHQPYARGQPGWAVFLRNLAPVRAYELRRGPHPSVAAARLRELLDAPARGARRA